MRPRWVLGSLSEWRNNKMTITILPWGRFVTPEIDVMPVKGEACPICDLMFTDMTPADVFQAHQVRCIEAKVIENKKMIGLGYKRTSKGWVME